MHISLKDGGTINIGGVSAPVIRTMVGPNVLDAITGGAVFFKSGPFCFYNK